MPDRKASDILLELEEKINNLEKNMKNIENILQLQSFQFKLIIDNLNKLSKQNQQANELIAPVSSASSTMSAVSGAESLIERKNRLMSTHASSLLPKELSLKQPPSENANNQVFVDGGKRVPITQKIVLFDGNPLPAARVIIKNEKNEQIKTIETNNTGRWQTALPPGKYSINVFGKYMGGAILEFDQSFEVPDISSTLELPQPQVYKRKPIKQ